MSFPAEQIRAGLKRLQKEDPKGRRVFGASAHGYRLEPVVEERVVSAFESMHGIVLPADYRGFLTHAGNGGAGPHYGVFRLGEMDDGHGHAAWKSGGFVGDPRKPFPHREAWNLPRHELEALQDGEDEDLIFRTYWVPVDGAIPVCHEGCALRDWLVVSGPEAGRIWHDATADYQGWKPVTDASGAHLTFEAWYLRWLDEALGALG